MGGNAEYLASYWADNIRAWVHCQPRTCDLELAVADDAAGPIIKHWPRFC